MNITPENDESVNIKLRGLLDHLAYSNYKENRLHGMSQQDLKKILGERCAAWEERLEEETLDTIHDELFAEGRVA